MATQCVRMVEMDRDNARWTQVSSHAASPVHSSVHCTTGVWTVRVEEQANMENGKKLHIFGFNTHALQLYLSLCWLIVSALKHVLDIKYDVGGVVSEDITIVD